MKFAKELERDAVPEWRIKYLNYKAGKKYVKAVARAVHRTSATPRSNNEQAPSYYTARSDAVNSPGMSNDNDPGDSFIERTTSAGARSIPASKHGAADEGQALNRDGGALQYGSFVATPPLQTPDLQQQRTDSKDSFFELPAPAMNPGGPVHGTQAEPHEVKTQADALKTRLGRDPARRSLSSSDLPTRHRTFNGDNLNKRSSSGTVPPPQGGGGLRRLLSQGPGLTPRQQMRNGFMMQSFDLVRERERDFYDFMDSELDKVETFYEMKENQAGKRLSILKEQLHEMRNRRINELARARQSEDDGDGAERRGSDNSTTNGWVRPIKAKMFPPGPNSKAMQFMPRTPRLGAATQSDAGRDYSRRPEDDEVSYRTAKRKLKLALQEFYRGLELLKSYALLNRTAFRKINKKFDKAANARPPYRFMNEKVNKAWFVNSDVLEGHIKAVEDLYARYFERGNHKLAAGKLRSLVKKHGTYASSTFQSGFLVGTGLVFSIQGLVYGVQVLFTEDHDLRQETSYLLQIYGGYFLMLLLFSLFCVNCFFWSKNKINYPFIFEFDQRHSLTWSQLSEFPSFFFLLFGIFFWANFSGYGPESLYLWYPVILIAITVVIIFLPAPVLAHRSRRWFLYAHWRLLLAGIYPVEFRDFFLGDIYCSLTYAMSNMELFFCLYRNEWDNPVQCNSNHSRLMGFLAALPPIWRLLQCLRRYRDTRNIFPHLINGGKYTMTILAAVCLSLYRISGSHGNLALFITFSLVNSVYCSIWDLFMDFSLLQAGSRHLGLRDILALKSRWPYYVIMVIDPIIRFAWVFYAIFTHNAQHSTIVSFMVGFVEVVRRGAWALLRVENEHCANVSQYKASRDVPLPYRIEPLMDQASADTSPTITPQREEHAQQAWQAQQQEAQQATQQQQQQQQQQQRQSDQEQGRITGSSTAVASTPGTVRNRKDTLSARTFSRLLAEAHKQDFVKRRKEAGQQGEDEDAARHGQLSDDDDDDDEDEVESDEHENSSEVRQVADLMRRGEASS